MNRRAVCITFLVFSLAWQGNWIARAESGESWDRVMPQDVGLNPVGTSSFLSKLRTSDEYSDITSLLIVRHGKLAVEEYVDGKGREYLRPVKSVTKSITSALIGIAIGQGAIRNPDESILSFFPGRIDIQNIDDRKRRMTLEDLLTMRSGTDFVEWGDNTPYEQMMKFSFGWDTFYLSRPMVRDPGEEWQYDSGGAILMSAILRQRTGLYADRYAVEHLFGPLRIGKMQWSKNEEGHAHSGGGLSMRPRDMAKFGQLYLQKGVWQGKQVVPENWVETSTKRQLSLQHELHPHLRGYGYYWWILEPDPAGSLDEDIYAAYGAHGQFIMVVPERDMVVVFTGNAKTVPDERRPFNILYSDILPLVSPE